MDGYNIYLRQDGRWEGRISQGKKENGKRKFLYIFGKSREAVRNKIDELRKNSIRSTSKTVDELFGEWYKSICYRVKESTLANYRTKALNHILPEFGHIPASDINSDKMYSFIEKKRNEGLSNRYIGDIIVLMKSVFKYAVKTYCIYNPMEGVSLPRKKTSDIRLLDKKEQLCLEEYVSKIHNSTTLGITLAMTTGIRIGELCGLKWEDIHLEKRILTVSKTVQRIQLHEADRKTKLIITEPKSESSKRIIPIPEAVVAFLKEMRENDEDFVVSGTSRVIEPRTMQYRFAKILKNVNLSSVHFHALRHMFASNCIRLGFDIKALSEILGHSSVEITLNRYVHSSFEQKTEYMNRITICV